MSRIISCVMSVSKLIYFNFIRQYMHGHYCSNVSITYYSPVMHHNLDISGNYTHNTTEIT